MRFVLFLCLTLCASPAIAKKGLKAPELQIPDVDSLDEQILGEPKAVEAKPLSGSARAILAAIVPGVLFHGAGQYAVGDQKTGRRLLVASAVGASLAAAGGATLFFTGANRRVSQVAIPLLVSGLGIFGATWLADLYGAATGGTTSSTSGPGSAVGLGYGFVSDPQFAYKHFAVADAHFRFGRFALDPSVWAALSADNQRSRLLASYGVWQGDQGSRLYLEVAGTNHRFGDDGFTTRVLESSFGGRWNLSSLGQRLSGAFVDMSAGFGYSTIDFELPGASRDHSTLLLGRIGFGLYLPADGEAEFYYNHRRDDLAGGISPSSRRGSGFAGHIGFTHSQPLTERFSIQMMAELGSAWVLSSGLQARWGTTE